jgi:adenylate cyclase, class 2
LNPRPDTRIPTPVSPRREIEIKVPVRSDDLEAIRRKAEAMGFHRVAEPTREENFLFDFSDRRLKIAGCALRLRRYGNDCVLTFKGPLRERERMKIREETESSVDNFASMERILESLGLEISFRYAKEREKFRIETESSSLVELCVDQTPFGCFIEIEGDPEDIHRVAREFGWSRDDFVTRSYVELYEEHGFGR